MTIGAISGGGAAAAAGAAAIAQAIKASGAIVSVEPGDFEAILSTVDNPLVVVARGGFIKANYQYLVGHKGLVFFTKSATPLHLGGSTELIEAKRIWIPA